MGELSEERLRQIQQYPRGAYSGGDPLWPAATAAEMRSLVSEILAARAEIERLYGVIRERNEEITELREALRYDEAESDLLP